MPYTYDSQLIYLHALFHEEILFVETITFKIKI